MNNNSICSFCFNNVGQCRSTCPSNHFPPAQSVAIEQKFKSNHIAIYMIKAGSDENRKLVLESWVIEELCRRKYPRRGLLAYYLALQNETQNVNSRLDELRGIHGVQDEAVAAGLAAATAANPQPPADDIQKWFLQAAADGGSSSSSSSKGCGFCDYETVCSNDCVKMVNDESRIVATKMEHGMKNSYIRKYMKKVSCYGLATNEDKMQALMSFKDEISCREMEPVKGLWGVCEQSYRALADSKAQLQVYENIDSLARLEQFVDDMVLPMDDDIIMGEDAILLMQELFGDWLYDVDKEAVVQVGDDVVINNIGADGENDVQGGQEEELLGMDYYMVDNQVLFPDEIDDWVRNHQVAHDDDQPNNNNVANHDDMAQAGVAAGANVVAHQEDGANVVEFSEFGQGGFDV